MKNSKIVPDFNKQLDLPPPNLKFEKTILSGIFIDPVLCQLLMTELKAEYFYSKAHRQIFTAAYDLFQNGNQIDAETVASWLRNYGISDMSSNSLIDLLDFTNSISNLFDPPKLSNYQHYAILFNDEFYRRTHRKHRYRYRFKYTRYTDILSELKPYPKKGDV